MIDSRFRAVNPNQISAARSVTPVAGSEPGAPGGPCGKAWQSGLALVGLVVLAYLPVWRAGFIWDDDSFLTNNPLIKQADGLYRFWFTTAAPDYFPLTSTTLWLEWRLWGMNPFGYHLVNVLLHALSAVLWWRSFRMLKLPGAWLAAALFALHPVNVESVAWITERKNVLTMFFYALTLLWFLKAEATGRRGWYWGSVGVFLLALLSKTSVTPLPFVLLGLAWWQREKVTRRDWLKSVPFFVLSLALGLVTMWFQSHRSIVDEIVRDDGLTSRLATAGSAVWFYLYKALVPLNLSFVYPRWEINAASASSYVPLVLLLGTFWLCWRYRKRWGRGWFFGLGYFVLLLLPVLGFVNIFFMRYSLVADHWQYFAMIAVAVAAAAGLEKLSGLNGSLGTAPAMPDGIKERIKRQKVSAGVLVVLGVLTWRQSAEYVDEETLWRATLELNPRSFMVLNNLGNRLLEKGQPAAAVTFLRKALAVKPDFAVALHNLGNALLETGQPEEALQSFRKAVEIQPASTLAQNNLGSLLLLKGQAAEAIPHFHAALKFNPDLAEAWYNLGNAQLQLGSAAEALLAFQKAVAVRPDYAGAHNNIGNLLFGTGKIPEAVRHLERAVAGDPGNVGMRENLVKALLHENRLTEAAAQMEQVSKIRPQDASLHNNLGIILVRLGRRVEAEAHFRKAIELRPDNALAHQNLGGILLDQRRLGEAAEHSRQALEIQPTLSAAVENLHDTVRLWAGDSDAALRDGAKAIEFGRFLERITATNDPAIIGTLAAAYAEANRFPEALAAGERAVRLAIGQNNGVLATNLQAQLSLYHARRQFRPASPVRSAP